MDTCVLQSAVAEANVGMGRLVAASGPARLWAVLGSCVGVAIHCPRQKVGALAHVVLPESMGRGDVPGKYADTAVGEMIRMLTGLAGPDALFVAKYAGGASMFGYDGPIQIGQANVEAVEAALRKAGIRVAAQDAGGRAGRRVTFDCGTGKMIVEMVGHPSRVL
ncbi:MAG: chemotaxis protein CheD [Pirellulales bacterium]|nr:chemotaxis protein CheD [Pirellulales bacterium]